MGIKLHSTVDGHIPSLEYLEAGAITPRLGLALKLASGKLAVASGTDVPEFICNCEYANADNSGYAAVTSGTIIPVFKVEDDMIFVTTNSAALTSVAVGAKVQLSSDGLQVTATTASTGGAEIVAKDADAVGSTVYVRF